MDIFFIACAVFPAIFIILALIKLLESIKIPSVKTKSVFITGCDTGFGYLLALRLIKNGLLVFAGCLTNEGSAKLTEEAKNYADGELQTVPLDVRNQESVDNAVAVVKKRLNGNGGLWGLVNNAGVSGPVGFDDFLTVKDYEDVLQINTFGVIRCTQAFKPLIKHAKGRIVTVASVYGRFAMIGVAPYSVSKFAIEAYCDALRHEVGPYGVSVHILEPGYFKTPAADVESLCQNADRIWDRAPKHVQREYGEEERLKTKNILINLLAKFSSPRTDFVVDAYVHALTAKFPRKRYWVGYDSAFFFVPLSTFPTGIQDLIMKILSKIVGLPKPNAVTNLK